MDGTLSTPLRIERGFEYGHKYQILNGGALKIIAVLSMFIDHLCAVLFIRQPFEMEFSLFEKISVAGIYVSPEQLKHIYLIGRDIGRLAFPLFCFLLVQGFVHSKDNDKYGTRLFFFAMISEMPFNLAFGGLLTFIPTCNVFWTLFFGHVALRAIEYYRDYRKEPLKGAFVVMGLAFLAHFFHSDYGAFGVLLIVLLYMAKNNPIYLFGIGAVMFLLMPMGKVGFLSFILMCLYNGERGFQLKYFFYLFYPAHLLFLYYLQNYMQTYGLHF